MGDDSSTAVSFSSKFAIGHKLGGGSFGDVFICTELATGKLRAMKCETLKGNRFPQLEHEAKIYKKLEGEVGFPISYWFGETANHRILVMDLMGPSLENLLDMSKRKLSGTTCCILAVQILKCLHILHSHHFIHRDIKPDNFVINHPLSPSKQMVHMIDFGLARQYRNPRSKQHLRYREGKPLTGTARYSSINTHMGMEQSRRDDVEAIGYVLVYLFNGHLPWQGLNLPTKKAKYEKISEIKVTTSVRELCHGCPAAFEALINHARGLRFESPPKYDKLRSVFQEEIKHVELDTYVFEWERHPDFLKLKEQREIIQNTGNLQDLLMKKSSDVKHEKAGSSVAGVAAEGDHGGRPDVEWEDRHHGKTSQRGMGRHQSAMFSSSAADDFSGGRHSSAQPSPRVLSPSSHQLAQAAAAFPRQPSSGRVVDRSQPRNPHFAPSFVHTGYNQNHTDAIAAAREAREREHASRASGEHGLAVAGGRQPSSQLGVGRMDRNTSSVISSRTADSLYRHSSGGSHRLPRQTSHEIPAVPVADFNRFLDSLAGPAEKREKREKREKSPRTPRSPRKETRPRSISLGVTPASPPVNSHHSSPNAMRSPRVTVDSPKDSPRLHQRAASSPHINSSHEPHRRAAVEEKRQARLYEEGQKAHAAQVERDNAQRQLQDEERARAVRAKEEAARTEAARAEVARVEEARREAMLDGRRSPSPAPSSSHPPPIPAKNPDLPAVPTLPTALLSSRWGSKQMERVISSELVSPLAGMAKRRAPMPAVPTKAGHPMPYKPRLPAPPPPPPVKDIRESSAWTSLSGSYYSSEGGSDGVPPEIPARSPTGAAPVCPFRSLSQDTAPTPHGNGSNTGGGTLEPPVRPEKEKRLSIDESGRENIAIARQHLHTLETSTEKMEALQKTPIKYSDEHVRYTREIFEACDIDGDGVLDRTEIGTALALIGHPTDSRALSSIMAFFGTETVDFDTFLRGPPPAVLTSPDAHRILCRRRSNVNSPANMSDAERPIEKRVDHARKHHASSFDDFTPRQLIRLREVFDDVDTDLDGLLDPAEIRMALKNLGRTVSMDDARAIVQGMDKSGCGKIDFEGFLQTPIPAFLDTPEELSNSFIKSDSGMSDEQSVGFMYTASGSTWPGVIGENADFAETEGGRMFPPGNVQPRPLPRDLELKLEKVYHDTLTAGKVMLTHELLVQAVERVGFAGDTYVVSRWMEDRVTISLEQWFAGPPSYILASNTQAFHHNMKRRVRAVAHHTAHDEDELSFEANDIIVLDKPVLQGWLCGHARGKAGAFPVACITFLEYPLPLRINAATAIQALYRGRKARIAFRSMLYEARREAAALEQLKRERSLAYKQKDVVRRQLKAGGSTSDLQAVQPQNYKRNVSPMSSNSNLRRAPSSDAVSHASSRKDSLASSGRESPKPLLVKDPTGARKAAALLAKRESGFVPPKRKPTKEEFEELEKSWRAVALVSRDCGKAVFKHGCTKSKKINEVFNSMRPSAIMRATGVRTRSFDPNDVCKMMQTFDTIIRGRNNVDLVALLRPLGEMHCRVGLDAEDFDAFIVALVKGLASILDYTFTDSMRNAWEVLGAHVAYLMTNGIVRSEKRITFAENLERGPSGPGPVNHPDPNAKKAVALWDFEKEEDDELQLFEGDIITLISCPPENEWWEGRLYNEEGFFPANFVNVIESPARQ